MRPAWLTPGLVAAVLLACALPAVAQDASWARAARYRGQELFRAQDYEGALRQFRDAQAIYGTLGETSTDNLDTLNDIANTLGRLQRPAEALPVIEQLARLETARRGERDERALRALDRLGGAYFQASRFAEAVATGERLLALSTAARGERHPATIQALRDLGIYHSSVGGYGAALPFLEKAAALRTQVLGPSDTMTLSAINDVANAYLFTGNYAKALEAYERIVRIKLDKGDDESATDSMRQLALMYGELGRSAEGLPIYEKLYQTKLSKNGERNRETLFAMADLAAAYNRDGRTAEALALMQKAVALRDGLLGATDPDSNSFLGLLASLYAEVGRPADALPLRERELAAERQRWGDGFTVLRIRREIGRLQQQLGRPAEAVATYEAVLRGRIEQLGERHPETVGSLRDLAESYEATGRAPEARPLYERLVTAVETLRAAGDLSSENRQALFAQWVPAYKRLARLTLAAGDRARAFELAELSKARTLLESTAFRRAAQSTELSDAEQQRLQGFERQIGDFGDRMAAAAGEERVALETRKNELVRELTRFRAELSGKYPKFSRLSDVRVLKAEDGRTALGDDVALISFLLVEDTPLLFTVTRRDGLTARELPKLPELAAMIERYRGHLVDPDAWRGPDSPGMRLGRELGERLLAPVANALRGKRHWIVSPDGVLATLPFDTVLIDGKPVIAAHDVSYIQSLSMLALLVQRDAEYQRLDGRKTLFAMGGAQYELPGTAAGSRGAKRGSPSVDVGAFVRRNARDVRAIQRAYDLLDLQWPDLPGSEREVDTVAAVFGGQPTTVLKQAQASEAKLLELNAGRELAAYRYLLFSTHGYLSTEEPALSAIVLSQRDKAGGTDGYVTASEWPAYELRSDLIVLSACETALGKVVQGEGVMGLPYALYVAGNRNTLLSLWPVVDESTAAFMVRLFTQLGAGKSQVQALSDTKREFLAGGKYTAPLFWAPFVLYGS